MRGSVLSDDKVMAEIAKNFVAFELNATDDGFPKNAPALSPWETAWKNNGFYKMAFATSTVIDPTGKFALGSSGAGYRHEAATATNYNADKYGAFLQESLKRHERLQQIENDMTISAFTRELKKGALALEILGTLSQKKK
jgi:hypothetical protein